VIDGDREAERTHIVLPTAPSRKVAEEWVLVLSSQRLKSRVERTPAGFILVVNPDDTLRAAEILATWWEENRSLRTPADLQSPSNGEPHDYVVAFAVVLLLLFFHVYVGRSEAPELYYRVGRGSAGQILGGEIWRAFTALTLHADLGHALGNTLFGGLLLASLSGRIGAGFALAGAILSGGLGNLFNALHHSPGHSSIGASTAVFGVVGLLCGVEAWRRKRMARGARGAWIPLAAGVGLLAMLGTGSARVDLAAHVFGLLSGMALGLAAASSLGLRAPSLPKQVFAGLASLLIIVECWVLAFGTLVR